MYDTVATCLIAAMSELGGGVWAPEMTETWIEALTAVASMMLAGVPEAQTGG